METISLADASHTYGITTQTLRRWAATGKITMVKPDGHHVHFVREELDREVPHVGRLLARLQAFEAREAASAVSSIVERSHDC